MTYRIIITAAALALAGAAQAGHPYAKGEEASNGIARIGVTQGTLHPGHVSVFATGKGEPEKYNKPAADFHLDGTPYPTGPGGYAETKKNN